MGFATGSVTFRRFLVVGEQPAGIDQAMLDRLSENALRPGDVGVPEEIEYGWCGGRHILDDAFGHEHNVFADCLHVALRVDTNRVPADLRRAYTLMEEEGVAASNPSGFISKMQKRDARDAVRRKLEDELRSGRHRRSRMIPILWDLPGQMLYTSGSQASIEKLTELFERTFGLALSPLGAGAMALRMFEDRGRRRDYEDFRPTRFVPGPDGEGQWPEYPWVAKGPEPKDFLGNEFLLWLWHRAEIGDGEIALAGDSGGPREVSLQIDRSLDLDCAFGQTGRDSLRGSAPARMPEARDALRSGKVPRRAGLELSAAGQEYNLTLNCETLGCTGTKLPEVEDAESPRVLFEERISLIRDLAKAIDGLFAAFLKVRASSSWEGQTSAIRRWIIASTPKAVAAVA
jgi:hypothetical protein